VTVPPDVLIKVAVDPKDPPEVLVIPEELSKEETVPEVLNWCIQKLKWI
jgi:hypothetical protein